MNWTWVAIASLFGGLIGTTWTLWVLDHRQKLHKEQIEFLTEQLAQQKQHNGVRNGVNQLMR